jgi:MFS family permease
MSLAMFLMGVAIAARVHPLALACLVFAAGFCIWGVWAPIFALLTDITPSRIRGTSFGLNNTINFIGSLVAPIATGWIRDVSGSFADACYLAAGIGVAGAVLAFLVHPAFRWMPEVSRNS